MNRIDHINKITTYSARFVLEVEGFNATSQYHINIHAESFLIPVLNETFGLELENLNTTQKKNYPAIDLADFKNKVAFQVTSTADFDKIKGTLETFSKYKLDQQFDVLYIYIITHKKEKYNAAKLAGVISAGFTFDIDEHILDKDDLLKKINAISSTPKLQAIAKIFEHEFSDVQIQTRQQKFVSGFLGTESESLLPNLLPITFPTTFYRAKLSIDEQEIISEVNGYLKKAGKKQIKSMKKTKMIRHALKKKNSRSQDWITHENFIYTFNDLNSSKEPLRQIIDTSSVEDFKSDEFYEVNEDNERVFKYLLKSTFIELCRLKQIEWFAPSEVFRFANNPLAPNQKRMKWKGKKEATKTVIFEMINKKEKHIICFRNLAFRASFLNIGTEWFLVINPTWSFTNPGGYKQSRFESDYMSGLKRMENNNAICNYFRFFNYYFTYVDLFSTQYPNLTIHQASQLEMSPKLEEGTWKPVKIAEKKSKVMEGDLFIDNELTDTSLFD